MALDDEAAGAKVRELAAEGLSMNKIAKRLGCSFGTVRNNFFKQYDEGRREYELTVLGDKDFARTAQALMRRDAVAEGLPILEQEHRTYIAMEPKLVLLFAADAGVRKVPVDWDRYRLELLLVLMQEAITNMTRARDDKALFRAWKMLEAALEARTSDGNYHSVSSRLRNLVADWLGNLTRVEFQRLDLLALRPMRRVPDEAWLRTVQHIAAAMIPKISELANRQLLVRATERLMPRKSRAAGLFLQ